MPSIIVSDIKATQPKMNAKLLEENQAQTALNVELRERKLQALKGTTEVSDLGAVTPKTLHKAGSTWIVFDNGEINSVVAAEIEESNDRFFWTDGVYPKQSDSALWSGTEYRLGVTPPAVAPTITIQGVASGEVQDTVSYVFTMVTAYGYESAPSPATAVTSIDTDQYIDLSVMTTPADAAHNFQYKNIYRLSSGTTGAEYQFLAQIAFAATTYQDKGTGNELGTVTTDVIATTDWAMPPNDLVGLTQAHNGMLIGFAGKEMYVSEVQIPYAYPTDYIITADSTISGIGAGSNFILMVSQTTPYIVTGTTPDSLVADPVSLKSQCAGQRSMVACELGVFYAAQDGLCLCDGSDVRVITKPYITSDQWKALGTPGSIIGTWYDDHYVGFYEGTANGIAISVETGEVMTFTLTGDVNTIRHVFHDSSTNLINILSYDGASDSHISSFETNSTTLSYTWKSKKFVNPNKFNCAMVRGEAAGTLTFKYYLDGSLKQTKTVTADQMWRLPEDSGSSVKEFELTGTKTVDSIQLATTPKELI
jgi:hypothetical protein